MNSNQQQTLDTLNQPPPSVAAFVPATSAQGTAPSHPHPPASSAPTASAPPPVTRGQVVGTAFKTLTVRGLVLGSLCGAAYGAVCGLFISPTALVAVPIAAILALIIGTIWGGLLGMIEGLIVGLVSAICFYPLRSWRPYRKVIGALCVLLTVGLSLAIGILWLFPDYRYAPHPYERLWTSNGVIFLFIPTLIAAVSSWFGSYQAADNYAVMIRAARQTLPYDLRTADIYDPAFQQVLFSELQPSYRAVADLTSLGMLNAWRRELVALMDLQPDARVCDLMSGAGQLWNHILPRLGPQGRLIAIDCTPAVVQATHADLRRLADPRVELRQGDALHTGLPDKSVDAVTCAFGALLIHPSQMHILADEIARILDDQGVVGLVDMRLPDAELLRGPYMFYLRRFVPLVGFAFGGDPYLYRTLAHAVEQNDALRQLEFLLAQRGFQLYRYHFSGGCAGALVGMKIGPRT